MMMILFAILVFPVVVLVGMAALFLFGLFMVIIPFIWKSLLFALVMTAICRRVCRDRLLRQVV